MKKSRAAIAACALVACLSASGCLASSRITPTEPAGSVFSPKLNPFVYYEDGPVLFVGVDVRAAQYVKSGQKIFPLGIGLANQSMTGLTFSRESFVLEGADGQRHPVVSVQEFNRDYTRSASDRRLADSFQESLTARFYNNYTFVRHEFFPARFSSATASGAFELGRLHWTQFYLYFPVPEGGIHGKEFNLLVSANEVPETFVVHFAVK